MCYADEIPPGSQARLERESHPTFDPWSPGAHCGPTAELRTSAAAAGHGRRRRQSPGRARIISWPKRAPAWARASPIWSPRFCTPRKIKPKPSEDEEDDKKPRRRIVISTHTISLQEQLIAQGLAAAEQRDSARVFGGAGEGPPQLSQPAAAEERRPSVEARCSTARRRFARCATRRRGRRPRATARSPIFAFKPQPHRVGRSRQRQRQLPGPQLPHVQALLLLRRATPGAERPDPDREPRPVLQRSGACGGKGRACCPITTR